MFKKFIQKIKKYFEKKIDTPIDLNDDSNKLPPAPLIPPTLLPATNTNDNINKLFTEMYDDFNARFENNKQIKEQILQEISEDSTSGQDNQKILKKHIYH